ncbi:hypothetical protein N7462_008960 [Penicillium macrosclerotiorum]|uniref:uncharacterized protein n=1 Tax=Penicillium macrosclerotiorum TaxID=303699 RepID=UPI002546D80A|nr:uncharacterized protein N7462_008960 [Penicillium macrosclerotiorum]KAJ5676063.1 hypothetical protein N7462_008960 [Penicillium macrosclerotiorum]
MEIVEGIWSVFVSLMLLFFLPERSGYGTRVDGKLGRTNSRSEAKGHQTIPLKMVWNTLTNIYKWPHFLATACVFSTWSPLTTYTPSIMMSLGFSRIHANALTAAGGFLTLPVVFFFAWLGDKTKTRGLTVMIAIVVYVISLVVLRTMQPHVGRWSKFGLWTTVNGLAVGYHPIHNAWIQMNSRSSEERSINLACYDCYQWLDGRSSNISSGRVIGIVSQRHSDNDLSDASRADSDFIAGAYLLSPESHRQEEVWL